MISRYFSGFCLRGEEGLFGQYSAQGDFCVRGFSLGAQRAFEYAYEMVVKEGRRVDTLQLFSPAFFGGKDEKFKRMQLMFFKKDDQQYRDNFFANCIYPNEADASFLDPYKSEGSYEELHELLYYEWDAKRVQELQSAGVKIEVYLGERDKIVDSSDAKEFFLPYGTLYFIKNAGHILKRKS